MTSRSSSRGRSVRLTKYVGGRVSAPLDGGASSDGTLVAFGDGRQHGWRARNHERALACAIRAIATVAAAGVMSGRVGWHPWHRLHGVVRLACCDCDRLAGQCDAPASAASDGSEENRDQRASKPGAARRQRHVHTIIEAGYTGPLYDAFIAGDVAACPTAFAARAGRRQRLASSRSSCAESLPAQIGVAPIR